MNTVCRTIATGASLCFLLQGFLTAQEARRVVDSTAGPVLYKYYCAVCHGEDGKGGGPMAAHLKTRPSDLTRIAARNGGKFPRTRVERTISGEEPLPAGHGTANMPVWGPIFSHVEWDQDLWRVRVLNVAKYIEQMQK